MRRFYAILAGLWAMLSGVGAILVGIMVISQDGGFRSVYQLPHGTHEILLSIATTVAGLLQLGLSLLLFR
ncbi:MAG: hypothetical protein ABSB33_06585 [Tepidisphaeraceae bacterium]|jgi:hypothetical protein